MLMKLARCTRLGQDEKGFASLIISITLVIVLSLLTVGFAELMRNEQNQVTNRQLNSQAYYAAESGINDATRALNAGYVHDKTYCGPSTENPATVPGASYLKNQKIDGTSTSTEWTCLLINPAPTSLEYGSVDTINPTTFTFSGLNSDDTPAPITSATIYWQGSDSTRTGFQTTPGANNNAAFPAASAWTNGGTSTPGVLRLAITPLTAYDRTSLINNTFTAFLYPSTDADNQVEAYTNDQSSQGLIMDGNCKDITSQPRFCSATINFPTPQTKPLLFDLRSIYNATNVYIQANTGNTRLVGAQSLVDSTGRSQDVLKRIQVRIPDQNSVDYPGFSLASMSGICKQIIVYPGNASGCGITPAPILPPICTTSPHDVALVLDNSHSMVRVKWGSLGSERDEVDYVANNFVKNMNTAVNDEAVIGFNKVATLYQAPGQAQVMTNNTNYLLTDINSYNNFNPKSGSSDYSNWFNTWYVINNNTALHAAKQALGGSSTRNSMPVQKIMIFISDGVANDAGLSQANLKKTINTFIATNMSGVKIFAIGINNNPNQLCLLSSMADPKVSGAMAGSGYVSAKSTNELEALINNIASSFNCPNVKNFTPDPPPAGC